MIEDEDNEEDYLEDEEDDFSDLDNIDDLLDEGLNPPPRKRQMNPNSLANLKRGGIDQSIKKNSVESRKKNVEERLSKIKEDPVEYYKNSLLKNLLNEEMNLEDLHQDLVSEHAKSNQIKPVYYLSLHH